MKEQKTFNATIVIKNDFNLTEYVLPRRGFVLAVRKFFSALN